MNNLTLNPLPNPLKSNPGLHSFPLDLADQDTLPISALIYPDSVHGSVPLPKDLMLFCYRALLNTIHSLLSQKYTDFDGHTTANCCHGMAVLAWHLIHSALLLDLCSLKQTYERAISYLEQHVLTNAPLPCSDQIPKDLVNLASLYILNFTKESDREKGGRTITKKLKNLAPISVNACNLISHGLKKTVANWIATSYFLYSQIVNQEMIVSDISIGIWSKYVTQDFIRCDRRGIKYASNLFSMQITLAYLSQLRAKVALVNDIQNPLLDSINGRYTCLFEGNGQGGFDPISTEDLHELALSTQDEPIIILGGCIYSDTTTLDSLSLRMQPWLDKLAQLILACDVFYPQFFKITDDALFDSTPIAPDEPDLRNLMDSLSLFGTHSQDPSLYCSTHIHPSSLKQFLDVVSGNNVTALPISFIPSTQRV